ncbi:aldehyde dehydrogenase family 8 member A1 [Syncephalis plumigaleata]|nr:aldehyde dehydrogenase family 8 member A1 [Syncephalis plumigaleata]
MRLGLSYSAVLSNFVNNEFVPPVDNTYIASAEPALGIPYLRVPDSSEADVDAAVQAANAAFPEWSRTPPAERAKLLDRVADLLEARLEEFVVAESRDQGKPESLAGLVDIPRSVRNFRYFADECRSSWSEEEARRLPPANGAPGLLSYTQRWPIGVAGLISPWNLPLYLLTWKIAPCLAAGCTCVCKPSEITSMTAYMLCEIIKDAGIPAGVVNMVFGTGPKTGNALVTHPRVPLISFTGSTATGQHIIRESASYFKKLSLELGGKNANIIFDDCDFEVALATTVRSSFSNQGEICLCGSRIFIQRGIYDKFLASMVERAKALVVGDPVESTTQLGALVSKEHMDKVLYYIQLAREEGGTIHCGGERLAISVSGSKDGWFVAPTIITNVSPKGRVMQEEIFGPVVTVTPFETEEEAIELANDSAYGLSASVWTENGRRQRRVAESLQVGTVWVNTWMQRDLHLPFGGCKQSGLGREGGKHSLDFYTEIKAISLSD